jgi:hypothetical protein
MGTGSPRLEGRPADVNQPLTEGCAECLSPPVSHGSLAPAGAVSGDLACYASVTVAADA